MYVCFSPDSDPSRRGEPTDDALRFFISEAEEFLFLLIVIFSKMGVVIAICMCTFVGNAITARREDVCLQYNLSWH